MPAPPNASVSRFAGLLRRLPLGLALGAFVGLVVKELDLAALTSFDGSREILVLVITAVVSILWTLGLRRTVGGLAAACGVLWCLVAFTPVSSTLAEGLVLEEVAEPGDAVFVSAAALAPGELGQTEERSRIQRGVELLARAKAPILVLVGGDRARAETAVETMQFLGVGPEKLMTLSASQNTREEAVAVGRLTREKGWKQVLVVTSPLHSRRLAACLAKENVPTVLVPSRETRFDPRHLSRAADRISAFGRVLHEQVGSVVYRLRGWTP